MGLYLSGNREINMTTMTMIKYIKGVFVIVIVILY